MMIEVLGALRLCDPRPHPSQVNTVTLFGESTRFQVPKNGTSDAETKKPSPLFNANIPPKGWITRLFYAFITFGWVLSQFSKFAFFGQFWSNFPSLTAKKLKVPFYNGRWPQIKKCKKTN